MNFVAVRKSKGLTQNAVAKKLNMDRSSISKWETGETYPRVELWSKLAQIYDITVAEILESKLINDEKDNKVKENTDLDDCESQEVFDSVKAFLI